MNIGIIPRKKILWLLEASLVLLLSWPTVATEARSETALLGQIRLSGTFHAFQPRAVLIQTEDGMAEIPIEGAQFLSGGTLLTRSQVLGLMPGAPVAVSLFPTSGWVTAIQGEMMTLHSALGPIRIPIKAIPESQLAGIHVSARLTNGRIVRVPFPEALRLQRTAGAWIQMAHVAPTRLGFVTGVQEIQAKSLEDVKPELMEMWAPRPLPQMGPGGTLPRLP